MIAGFLPAVVGSPTYESLLHLNGIGAGCRSVQALVLFGLFFHKIGRCHAYHSRAEPAAWRRRITGKITRETRRNRFAPPTERASLFL